MNVFFAEFWDSSAPFLLSEEESRHISMVLRYQVGHYVYLTDGKGSLILAQIVQISKKNVLVQFVEKFENNSILSLLHISIAPTKNIERIEWMIEKLCEVGVGKISLVCTERTIRKQVNLARLEKIIQSACKQSKQFFFPKIEFYNTIEKWLEVLSPNAIKYIATIGAENNLKEISTSEETIFFVGPEGDFTADEIEKCIQFGFRPISIANSILRTETAGLVVGIQYNFLNPN